MTASEGKVVFDSWAWVEVLHDTPAGRRLHAGYVSSDRVVTPALAVTEVAGRYWRLGAPWQQVDQVIASLRARSDIHPLDDDVAALAAQLSKSLRERDPNASYADAVMLATARTLGLPLVSHDPAFRGCPDVRSE